MKTELERFHETVGILVKAYLNDTLEHTNCHACAVGNMIASKMGISIIKNKRGMEWSTSDPAWFDAIGCGEFDSSEVTR